ncbi:MAG: hypothetical protein DRP78_05150 [Candidatus Omnitrophota bacterium]|nr:MAG: hypothetical protein DRP78_05150 [Candidatus Omnitrophota bacterium]
MAFAISTTWNAALHNNADAIVGQICELHLKNLELSFNLSSQIVQEFLTLKEQGVIHIHSVHNFCPVPDDHNRLTFLPDSFSLSDTDETQRIKAVNLTCGSLRTAKDIGAKALVIHAGRVEMQQLTKKLAALYEQGLKGSQVYNELLTQMRIERQSKKEPYFRALLRSIETLLPEAANLEIKLCLENRYYFREFPSLDEFAEIFGYFNDNKYLFYWHDTGHAQVAENLGFFSHSDYLKRYAHKMCGIHIHDASGASDHQPPGQGNLDFRMLIPYLNAEMIKVLEIHQPATAAQIDKSISYLTNIGIDG